MSVFPSIFHPPELSVHGKDEKREEDGAENNLGDLEEKAVFCTFQLVGSLDLSKSHIVEIQGKTIKVVVAKLPADNHPPPSTRQQPPTPTTQTSQAPAHFNNFPLYLSTHF